MTIFLNGEEREVGGGATTVAGLLERFELPRQRVAIELNRRVIRKQDWESTEIGDKDRVEVVHFVGGG